jgi:hypothetical protein
MACRDGQHPPVLDLGNERRRRASGRPGGQLHCGDALDYVAQPRRIVFNGGQAVERSPGFYLVGLLPEKPNPSTDWLPATYVLGIRVKRRRRWIGTDVGQAFLSFTVPWPST